jgi:hypothetical protein
MGASYSSDRELIFRIYKELKKLNTKREKESNKCAEELSRQFSKEG